MPTDDYLAILSQRGGPMAEIVEELLRWRQTGKKQLEQATEMAAEINDLRRRVQMYENQMSHGFVALGYAAGTVNEPDVCGPYGNESEAYIAADALTRFAGERAWVVCEIQEKVSG